MNNSFCLPCRIPLNQAEIAYAVLYSRRCLGINEKDDGGMLDIDAFFDDERNAGAAQRCLQKSGIAMCREILKLPWQDWMAKWREDVKPVHLCDGL